MSTDVWFLAANASFDEFVAAFQPSDADRDFGEGQTLLHRALTNGDLSARVAISSFLLDEGADATALSGVGGERNTVLHALLGRGDHDVPAEVPLLRRLIEAGADINHFSGRFRTPLLTIARQAKFSDATLAPFYDVFFEQPHLDLLATAKDGRSVYESIQLMREPHRSDLKRRAAAYLAERGQQAPETTAKE